jgi:subtilisin-like proprotein convertase family protein
VFVGFTLTAQASIDFTTADGGVTYTASASGLGQTLPDNTEAGVGYALNFGASGLNIGDISVSFNMSGGYDGNIYAYLSHGSQIALLVNLITGAANSSGFDVTLTTGTGSDIHTASGTAGQPLTGTFLADGTGAGLTTFQNTDPNGSWTLFFADEGPGDAPTLNNFSVDITPVPEPVNVALAIFGVALLGTGVARWRSSSTTAGCRTRTTDISIHG